MRECDMNKAFRYFLSVFVMEIKIIPMLPTKWYCKMLKLKLSQYTPRRRLGGGGGEGGRTHKHSRIPHKMGWVVSVTPRPRFSPREKTSGTQCAGGWVGPTAGLDTEVRGKILSPLQEIEPWSLQNVVALIWIKVRHWEETKKELLVVK
jgi:hypothetical protein